MNLTKKGTRCYRWQPFEEARAYVQILELKNRDEWRAWCKSGAKLADIPFDPNIRYKKEWISFGEWLGTGRTVTSSYGHRQFEEAHAFPRSLGLKNALEWLEFCKSALKPKDIPYQPLIVYKEKSWISYADWLGTGK
jgi:hypothetical protein